MKVSVKSSQTGKWGLAQSFLAVADYVRAIEGWRSSHDSNAVVCLVQFKGVPVWQCPRVYLATNDEIAEQLKKTCNDRRATILYENHTCGQRATAGGKIEKLPDSWRFSEECIQELMRQLGVRQGGQT